MQPDQPIGRRLAAARRERHLSQRALAAALGVSVRTVQNYEAGRFTPYRHLDALARLLGRSPSWLLHGDEQPRGAQLVAASGRQQAELRQNLERLNALLGRSQGEGTAGDELRATSRDHRARLQENLQRLRALHEQLRRAGTPPRTG